MAGNKNDYFFRLFQRRSRPIHYFFSSCKYSEKRRERERARGGKNIICHWIINQCKSVGKQQLFFFPPQPPFQRRAHSEIHPRIVQPKPINHACVGRRPCNATNAQ